MRHRFAILCIANYLLVATIFQAHGQEAPYAKWLSLLTARDNLQLEKFGQVLNDLKSIDAVTRCSVMDTLLSKGSIRNKRLQIRLLGLAGLIQIIKPDEYCAQLQTPDVHFLKALTLAYDLEDEILVFQLYKSLGSYYASIQDLGQAILYEMLAKELYEKHGRPEYFSIYQCLQILSLAQYHFREYRSCITNSKLLLLREKGYLNKTEKGHPANEMFAWNTLGLAYSKLNIPDSAFWAFDHAFKEAEAIKHPFWQGIITGNMGDVYYKLGQLDSAQTMLAFDYTGSIAASQFDNAANSLQWLARIDLAHHHPYDALRKVRTADSLLTITSHAEYQSNTWLTYVKVFSSLGQADSVSYYLDKFLPLHDSIEQAAADNRDANVRMRLERVEQIHAIKTLNKEKRNVALVRNLIIVIILFTAVIGFIILNRQKLQLKVKRQEAMEAKRKAEGEALRAKEQLNLFTQNLIEKTSLVETLQNQLLERELSEEQKNQITELSRHSILTDEDWDHFKTLFEKVYPAFFFQLKKAVPDLTTADQRMAALSKLQLSNKEAASLLGIAPNSVIKARQRLRQRLGLEPDSDLEQFFEG